VLESSGATVIAASNVSEAIATFDRAFPDVLVSDIGMPVQDGYALIRHIRGERPPDQSVLPALALTAYGTAEQRSRILASGFHAYLIKPVGASESGCRRGANRRRTGPYLTAGRCAAVNMRAPSARSASRTSRRRVPRPDARPRGAGILARAGARDRFAADVPEPHRGILVRSTRHHAA
jgi:CheY-like chemotaxis protein